MRVNVYTEELKNVLPPFVEIVTAEYVSSRTGQLMKNYGLRIHLASAPELHYIPKRDDDRSAITFWCGSSNRNILEFLQELTTTAEQYNLEHHRSKVQMATQATEIAESSRKS